MTSSTISIDRFLQTFSFRFRYSILTGMKNIEKIFAPFFTFGNFFGYFPFRFFRNGKCGFRRSSFFHSTLMLLFWIVSFINFAFVVAEMNSQGSNMSKFSSTNGLLLITIDSLMIIIGNGINYKYFEELVSKFWNFDVKVMFIKYQALLGILGNRDSKISQFFRQISFQQIF